MTAGGRSPARVLVIAGSDSSGGAGIQADIKTITILGGYAATAVTALTAQDTTGVHAIQPVPPAFVTAQIAAVLDDIGADAIKIGMLGTAEIAAAVRRGLASKAAEIPIVLDPVLVAKGGARLFDEDALGELRSLVKFAALVTPNIPEAEALLDRSIAGPQDMAAAARALCDLGAGAALVTGGHMVGDEITDMLVSRAGERQFTSQRIDTPHTHGTGCTLSSAIATGLAKGLSLEEAVAAARDFVLEAIRTAPGIGKGHGPLNFIHPLSR